MASWVYICVTVFVLSIAKPAALKKSALKAIAVPLTS